MAEGTRLRDLQEAQKKFDQILQTEALKREATELKLQEQISGVTDEMQKQFAGVEGKFDHLTITLATIQLQLLNMTKMRSGGDGESVLGNPEFLMSGGDGGSGGSHHSFKYKLHNESGGSPMITPLPKLEFPRFDGTHPRAWILKCQSYFKLIPNIPEQQKVTLASMHLEGKANQWYQYLSISQTDLNWAQFIELVSARFEELKETKIVAEFNKLKMMGSYADYVEKFEELRACLLLIYRGEFSEDYFIASFISGLGEELQSFIRMFNPSSLQQAMELGKNQIHTLEAISKKMRGTYRGNISSNQGYKRPDFNPVNNTKAIGGTIKTPFKLLTAAEMDARREKGLCYNCDEQYAPGHRCKVRITYVIMTQEEETQLMSATLEEQAEGEDPKELEEISLAFSAITGEGGPTTMRVIGEVNGHKINILIDSGSTLSFVSEATAKLLNSKLEYTKPILVKVANGSKMVSSKLIKGFKWNIQQQTFTYSPRVLATEGCDLILGGDWLKSCTPVELDYDKMTVAVTQQGRRLKIQAITGEELCQMISGPSLFKLIHQENLIDIEEIYQLVIRADGGIVSKELDHLLDEYKEIFEEPQGLPPKRDVEHQIRLKPGSIPKFQCPYRVSHDQKNEVEKIVSSLLESGEIQPSKSPFASPVILVKKKDSTWRMCVDYRYLNNLTIKHNYPIPVIEELLDELGGSKYYSKIDLRSGYFQILVAPEYRYLTAFRTHNGHYEFLVMPFGLCNAPATFQSLMNQLFRRQLRRTVLVFFDDILVFSNTWDEHLLHLKEVLQILKDNKLFAKRSKCQFGQTKISYLGHIISAEGVATDPEKIDSMLTWPRPKTLKQLRGFLGLTGYYRRFVQGYGQISQPLTALLKKGSFVWGAEADRAFEKLKLAMSSAPVLTLPDFTQPFVLETDASGTGIGAVLMQQGRPIAYLSKTLSLKHQALSIYEREFLAILLAIQRWKHYL